MNTDYTNYGLEIVSHLEAKGFTKDMVIGYLQGTLNGLRYLENEKVLEYLKRTVEQSKRY